MVLEFQHHEAGLFIQSLDRVNAENLRNHCLDNKIDEAFGADTSGNGFPVTSYGAVEMNDRLVTFPEESAEPKNLPTVVYFKTPSFRSGI